LLNQAEKFQKVFVLAGNHEFYHSVYEDTYESIKNICAEHENLIFMHKSSYLLEDRNIRILGTTLWSHVPDHAKIQVQNRLTDYSKIQVRVYSEDPSFSEKGKEKESNPEVRLIRVEDTNKWHKEEVEWLKMEIQKSREKKEKIIILTHHSPIFGNGCNNPEMWEDETNFVFSTDLTELMNEDILLWGYGHTHWFHDMCFSGTHVVSNPHGYPIMNQMKKYDATKNDNPYDPSFVVEILS